MLGHHVSSNDFSCYCSLQRAIGLLGYFLALNRGHNNRPLNLLLAFVSARGGGGQKPTCMTHHSPTPPHFSGCEISAKIPVN